MPANVKPGQPNSPEILARLCRITKRFGPVTVLEDVDLEIRAGEVHVLAGENGAGKSTLIRILGGVYTDFDGQMQLAGRPYRPQNPLDAGRRGVALIHQELSLVPEMSVADNVFLGRSPCRRTGFIDDRRQRTAAVEVLRRLGLELDVSQSVASFPIATQQRIEIAKAISQQARVLVMDEPTSALNAPEVERLFQLVRHLKQQGCGIIYITHKMEEIERLADRITVLRDGRRIGSAPAAELPQDRLIQWMVGRPMTSLFPRHMPTLGDEVLGVKDFSVFPQGPAHPAAVRQVSFAVRAGEIVGIGGLHGSGASELLGGIFGAYGSHTQGQLWLGGRPATIRSPQQAIRRRLALLTNDRKATGLVVGASIVRNTVLADLVRLSPGGWCRSRRERQATQRVTAALRLRAASLDMLVAQLSGGNQQKVALAKWLQTQPQLLLLDEPTRGIDVGAKREIYELMNEWTAQGIAILLITSEMPELLAMSDRILVLHRGRCTAQFPAAQATAAKVLEAAMGQTFEPVLQPSAF
jgi:ABC-type sugar transport system ATPase subunit